MTSKGTVFHFCFSPQIKWRKRNIFTQVIKLFFPLNASSIIFLISSHTHSLLGSSRTIISLSFPHLRFRVTTPSLKLFFSSILIFHFYYFHYFLRFHLLPFFLTIFFPSHSCLHHTSLSRIPLSSLYPREITITLYFGYQYFRKATNTTYNILWELKLSYTLTELYNRLHVLDWVTETLK